jgi:single stranded DNA-binding protein
MEGCMNGSIETAFIGRLGQDPELKTSAAGKTWTRLNLAVGLGEDAQWVSVATFGKVAERLCATLHKGDKLYVEGILRLTEWTGRDGEKRTGLSVAAWKADKLGAIGRKRVRRKARGAGGERAHAPSRNTRLASHDHLHEEWTTRAHSANRVRSAPGSVGKGLARVAAQYGARKPVPVQALPPALGQHLAGWRSRR